MTLLKKLHASINISKVTISYSFFSFTKNLRKKLQYVILVEKHKESPASRSLWQVEKGEVFQLTFSDDCGNSLTLHQNLTSGSFLKVN